MTAEEKLLVLNRRVVRCRRCPRLVRYRERVAREKRRAFREWEYWGRPVPGFGDPEAELLVLGLAPAAHGATAPGGFLPATAQATSSTPGSTRRASPTSRAR